MLWVIIGAGFQILGLVCAAIGLGQTWAENPREENLVWRIFGRPIRWVGVHVLRRRPRPNQVALAAALITVTSGVRAHPTKGLNANGSQEDWIRQVKAEVDATDVRAHQAHALAERAQKRVADLEDLLRAEIARVEADLETARRAEAADTVPLATIGLAVTAVGTVLGLVGSLMTAGAD